MAATELRIPSQALLPAYVATLESGWSADNIRGKAAADEELERIRADAAAFVALLDDRDAKGPPFRMPDGSIVQRLPGFTRWIWEIDADGGDGGFCGSINFRWQPGTTAMRWPNLGHIGYAVVPWKRRRGHATRALAQMLRLGAQACGLPFVELTTDADNAASRRVIEACGGVMIESFDKPIQFGGRPSLRYRIEMARGESTAELDRA